MRKLKEKSCSVCGKVFLPTGSCCRFCSECRIEERKALARKGTMDYRRRKGFNVGGGKGSTTGFVEANHMYKHGIGVLNRLRHIIKSERRYCACCNKDLIDATHYQWCIHHIDHNRYNNPMDGSNWKLLCKKCHQVEHQCWKAFEGATTREESRSSQEGSEVQSNQFGQLVDDIV